MSPYQTLPTFHAGYIVGRHANYSWYSAARLDCYDAVCRTQTTGLQRLRSKRSGDRNHSEKSLTSSDLECWHPANVQNNMRDFVRRET
jgi:hypothetical protein